MDAQTPERTQQGSARWRRRFGWKSVVSMALLFLLAVLFDWNWFRAPLESYISHRTEREFHISHLAVTLGPRPTIQLRDVYFANAPWSKVGDPMARIGWLEFSVSLRDVWEHKVFVPRAAVSNAELVFERASDKRKNWVLKPPERSAEEGRFRIGSVSFDQARVRYVDHGEQFSVEVQGHTAGAPIDTTDANAVADNTTYAASYVFSGHYHGAAFKGEAQSGEVLSFRQSHLSFPLKGSIRARTAQLSVEGKFADVADLTSLDAAVRIEGGTLADLTPFVVMALPATPPFAFSGQLSKNGDLYRVTRLSGKVGNTDLDGEASYEKRAPRPFVAGKLHSKVLDTADLGLVAGAGGKHPSPAPPRKPDSRRLDAIDAEVDYIADRFKAPAALALENMQLAFRLRDSVGTLSPLQVGFAGGNVIAKVVMDTREGAAIRSTLDADVRGVKIAKLFPALPALAKGAGEIGAQVRLRGSGNTIQEAAAASSGSITATIARGRISNLVDAAAGLNGGKVIALLAGGDKEIAIHCGGLAIDVKEGVGRSRVFVIDTEQTRIEGAGTFNLKTERIDATIMPVPKKPSFLSVHTPVHITGNLWHPELQFEKKPLLLRGGAAAALALVNPLAALLPLIDTGSGPSTDCPRLSAQLQGAAQAPAGASPAGLPKAVERGGGSN